MRAACLVALVLLVVETSCLNRGPSIFQKIVGINCCKPNIERDLDWKKIISYSNISENCLFKAVVVTLKKVKKPCCFDATKESTLRAIELFDKHKTPKKN